MHLSFMISHKTYFCSWEDSVTSCHLNAFSQMPLYASGSCIINLCKSNPKSKGKMYIICLIKCYLNWADNYKRWHGEAIYCPNFIILLLNFFWLNALCILSFVCNLPNITLTIGLKSGLLQHNLMLCQCITKKQLQRYMLYWIMDWD